MSTTTAGSRHSMREQLDELDALLQRMLALPLNGPERAPAPPPAEEPMSPAALRDAWKAPAMTLLADSGPVAAPAAPPRWDPNWSINLYPQNGSSILGSRSPTAIEFRTPPPEAPAWRPEPVEYVAAPTPIPEPPPTITFPQPPSPVTARLPRRPEANGVLAIVDRTFDALVGIIPFGSLLSTRWGKNLVGFAGIAMIVAGAAWGVADFMGWTR